MEPIFNLTHARYDRLHCLTPGLFRSLKRGERKKSKLDISYEHGGENVIRFIGFEPLGADDLRFLQGLVALAGPDSVFLTPTPIAELGKKLRADLEPKFDAEKEKTLVVRDSISRVLTEVGLTDGGDNIKAFKASLLRMSNVTVAVKQKTYYATFHLLSYAFEKKTGQLYVSLNPQVTKAIIGTQQHTHIEMHEVRNLKGDAARLAHQRLCGWIDQGKLGRVTMDTLEEYIWASKTTGSTMRMRRKIIRSAILELKNIGWKVDEYVAGKFEIRRPLRKNHIMEVP